MNSIQWQSATPAASSSTTDATGPACSPSDDCCTRISMPSSSLTERGMWFGIAIGLLGFILSFILRRGI